MTFSAHGRYLDVLSRRPISWVSLSRFQRVRAVLLITLSGPCMAYAVGSLGEGASDKDVSSSDSWSRQLDTILLDPGVGLDQKRK